uniref:hypothetical protein n=1 Tax=uncultured Caulobacter sp. TaxID=158749 RepID=UPI0025E10CAC|nr:hypothetical protein [uncultured Caulobacter sp.]
MTDPSEPRIPRLSRRAVLAAPAGLAAPAIAGAPGDDCVVVCRAWLANKAEMMRLLDRWAEIEDRLMDAGRRAGSDHLSGYVHQAPPLRAIDARLDQLGAERQVLAPKLAALQATTREAVMLKLEVVTAELFVQDFPVIYGLLHTAVRELDALW